MSEIIKINYNAGGINILNYIPELIRFIDEIIKEEEVVLAEFKEKYPESVIRKDIARVYGKKNVDTYLQACRVYKNSGTIKYNLIKGEFGLFLRATHKSLPLDFNYEDIVKQNLSPNSVLIHFPQENMPEKKYSPWSKTAEDYYFRTNPLGEKPNPHLVSIDIGYHRMIPEAKTDKQKTLERANIIINQIMPHLKSYKVDTFDFIHKVEYGELKISVSSDTEKGPITEISSWGYDKYPKIYKKIEEIVNSTKI
jgi:hypothetical protein